MYRTLDPSTEELLESFEIATDGEVEGALDRAASAFGDWRRRRLDQRLEILTRASEILEARSEPLALLMATEVGKPIAQGRGEVGKCAWVCRHYVDNAEEYLRPREFDIDGAEARIRFDPLGPIFAIMPWNFPFWQVFRFAAPALAAGNVALLKHAPNAPRSAAAIEEIFREAGAPEGVFKNLYLSNEQAAGVIEHRKIRGVTLTGSTRAGSEVAAAAGRALKPMVLELGGSDPFIVFEDADLDEAIAQGVLSRCLNNGQSCIAAKRFLVQEKIYDEFLGRLVRAMEAQTIGDPRDEAHQIGPLARVDLRDGLASQVEKARGQGGEVLIGGEIPERQGFFYPPTVIAGLRPDSETAQEELFGPVATVYPFRGEKEALDLANGTAYGLGASLWTRDRERADRLIPDIDAGSVFVNGFVRSDPRLPFGGTKQSGFGRELAREGMAEFLNVKTVFFD